LRTCGYSTRREQEGQISAGAAVVAKRGCVADTPSGQRRRTVPSDGAVGAGPRIAVPSATVARAHACIGVLRPATRDGRNHRAPTRRTAGRFGSDHGRVGESMRLGAKHGVRASPTPAGSCWQPVPDPAHETAAPEPPARTSVDRELARPLRRSRSG
jgi:hypothetical protein